MPFNKHDSSFWIALLFALVFMVVSGLCAFACIGLAHSPAALEVSITLAVACAMCSIVILGLALNERGLIRT